MIAVFFLLFALPCFLFVKERGNPDPREVFSLRMLRESTRDTIRTIRSTSDIPGCCDFWWDVSSTPMPINTVISIMVLYTINVAEQTGLTYAQGEQAAQADHDDGDHVCRRGRLRLGLAGRPLRPAKDPQRRALHVGRRLSACRGRRHPGPAAADAVRRRLFRRRRAWRDLGSRPPVHAAADAAVEDRRVLRVVRNGRPIFGDHRAADLGRRHLADDPPAST